MGRKKSLVARRGVWDSQLRAITSFHRAGRLHCASACAGREPWQPARSVRLPSWFSHSRCTSPQEMDMKSLAKPHPRDTLVWSQCPLEAISCGKYNWSVPACSRSPPALFSSPVQELPVSVPPWSATLVLC